MRLLLKTSLSLSSFRRWKACQALALLRCSPTSSPSPCRPQPCAAEATRSPAPQQQELPSTTAMPAHPTAGWVLAVKRNRQPKSVVSRIMAVMQWRHEQECKEAQQQPVLLFFSNHPGARLFLWKSCTLPASSSSLVFCTASETARQRRKLCLSTTREAAEHWQGRTLHSHHPSGTYCCSRSHPKWTTQTCFKTYRYFICLTDSKNTYLRGKKITIWD